MLATEIVTPSVERQKKYYVYTLAYPDGTVFYVGKGTVRQRKDRLFTSDTRMEDHEQEARRGVKSPKCEIIRKIWASGDQVCKSKVFETDDELEALKYEQALIWQFSESGHLANAESYNLNQIMSISDIPDHQILSSEVAQEEEKYLTVKKACDFLGVKRRTLARWTLQGHITKYRIGNAYKVYYRLSELKRLLDYYPENKREIPNNERSV